jgi:muconolactone D-isomerase
MEFLVTMTTNLPEGTSEEAVEEVRTRETARSRELAAQGHLLRLWRPPLRPGEWRTFGLFAADDPNQLEEVLASMPLRVWRTDEVMPSDKKVVVSTTLTDPEWQNTTVISDDVPGQITNLKAETDGVILVAGSGTLVGTLLEHDLVDELRLMVFPTIRAGQAPLSRWDRPAEAAPGRGQDGRARRRAGPHLPAGLRRTLLPVHSFVHQLRCRLALGRTRLLHVLPSKAWALRDSNPRPLPCKGSALAS